MRRPRPASAQYRTDPGHRMGASASSWAPPKVGERVRMRARKTEIVGILERWDDDSDTQIAFVEGWATVRLDDRSTRVFRRTGGLGVGGWTAQAKTLRNAGDFRTEAI